jgi:mono/diheme cytochrome c family protein
MLTRRPATATACATAWLGLVGAVHAQAKREADFLGPPSCAKATTACHKKPTNQWKTIEPQTLGADAHFNTATRLTSDAKSKEYLAKLKWAPDDKRCTECHATVVPNLARGRPVAGVSCESCHGGGKDYLDKHAEIPDDPTAYDASVKLGLAELRKGPKAIAVTCARCHVIADPQVLGAGHPDGSKWNAGEALGKVNHWDRRPHSAAELKVAVDGLKAAKLKGGPRVADVKPTDTPKTSPGPGPATPATRLEDIPELPEGFDDQPAPPSTTTRSRTTSTAPAPAPEVVKQQVSPAADAPTALTTTGGPTGEVQPAAAVTGEIAVRSPLSEIAALRRSVIDLVLRVLDGKAQGRTAPAVPPPPPGSAEYTGPDGELLRLQDEILRLALESLRRSQESRP